MADFLNRGGILVIMRRASYILVLLAVAVLSGGWLNMANRRAGFRSSGPPVDPTLVMQLIATADVAASGTWIDASGNSDNGTLVGNAYVSSGDACYLDGASDYVTCSSAVSQQVHKQFSIVMWIYRTSNSNTHNAIWSTYAPSGTPTLNMYIYNTSAIYIDYGAPHMLSGAHGMSLNAWYRLIVTCTTGGTLTIYRNGTQILQNASAGLPASSNTAWQWGRRGYAYEPAYPYFLQGRIDDCRVYSEAKDATWVLDDWNATKALKGY